MCTLYFSFFPFCFFFCFVFQAFATMSWVADAPRDLYKEVEYFQVQIELAPMATVIDAIKEYMDRKKKGKSKKDDEEEIDPEFPYGQLQR